MSNDCDECQLNDLLNGLKERVKQLESKLFVSEACQIHRLYFADQEVKKFTTDRFMGSGIILTVHSLDGKELVSPVMINGLSDKTIEGLREDFARNFEDRTELRPGLVGKDKGSTGE